MAVIPIPNRPEPDRDFTRELAQILDEIRQLRTLLDTWPIPDTLPHARAQVIPIDARRPRPILS